MGKSNTVYKKIPLHKPVWIRKNKNDLIFWLGKDWDDYQPANNAAYINFF
jgi:hypothetical protein